MGAIDSQLKRDLAEIIKSCTDDVRSDARANAESIRTLQRQVVSVVGGDESVMPLGNGRVRNYPVSRNTAEFFGRLTLAMLGSSKDREWLIGNGAKAISGENDTAGGFLAPITMRDDMIVLQEKHGVCRANTLVWPLSSDFEVVPKQTGELSVYCPGAGTAPTESDPTFGQVGIQAHEWLTYTLVNRNISEDAVVAVGQIVANSIARAFAKKEDNCAFNGDGTATYFNIQGLRAALVAVDGTIANIAGLIVGAGNAYSELTLANFESVAGILPEYADEGAAWYCSRVFYWTVMARVALAAGGANATEVQMFPREHQFLGYPVRFTQVMPTAEANDQVCCLFGDLGLASKLGDRRTLEVATSEHVKFAEGQIAIRGAQRVGITVHDVGDTSDAGPVVGLITAGS